MLGADSKALSDFWRVIDGLDPDRSLKLREKLEGRWDNPPTHLFSTVLERDVTVAEVSWQGIWRVPSATLYSLPPDQEAHGGLMRAVAQYRSTALQESCLPRTNQASILLQVQELLFAPNSTQMGLYAQLLLGDTQHVSDLGAAANKAQIMVLSHMYLVHGRCWNNLRPFIEAGGLRCVEGIAHHDC